MNSKLTKVLKTSCPQCEVEEAVERMRWKRPCGYLLIILIDSGNIYGSVSEKMSLRYIWVSLRENEPSLYIYKSYKNHSRLNRYNFRTVHAIDFLFSPLHTTPFLYGKILFGVLHLLRARIATSDTPQGMNPS